MPSNRRQSVGSVRSVCESHQTTPVAHSHAFIRCFEENTHVPNPLKFTFPFVTVLNLSVTRNQIQIERITYGTVWPYTVTQLALAPSKAPQAPC
jgi:hypothetical protein